MTDRTVIIGVITASATMERFGLSRIKLQVGSRENTVGETVCMKEERYGYYCTIQTNGTIEADIYLAPVFVPRTSRLDTGAYVSHGYAYWTKDGAQETDSS